MRFHLCSYVFWLGFGIKWPCGYKCVSVWIQTRQCLCMCWLFVCGFCVLFSEPTRTDFSKLNFSLKLSLTVLFTYLKIILLQCFYFLVFNNKRYPNNPIEFEFSRSKVVSQDVRLLMLLESWWGWDQTMVETIWGRVCSPLFLV